MRIWMKNLSRAIAARNLREESAEVPFNDETIADRRKQTISPEDIWFRQGFNERGWFSKNWRQRKFDWSKIFPSLPATTKYKPPRSRLKKTYSKKLTFHFILYLIQRPKYTCKNLGGAFNKKKVIKTAGIWNRTFFSKLSRKTADYIFWRWVLLPPENLFNGASNVISSHPNGPWLKR